MRLRILLLLATSWWAAPVGAQAAVADSLLDRAVDYLFVQLDSVRELSQKAVRHARRGDETFLLAESYEFLGNYHAEMGTVDSVAYYLDLAQNLYQVDTSEYATYYTLSLRARVAQARGEDDEALRIALQLINECHRIGDQECLADAFWEVGGVFYYQDLHEEAVEYSNRALSLMRAGDDTLAYVSALISNVESLRKTGDMARARADLVKARDLLRGQQAPLLLGELYMQAGANHLAADDLDLAEASLMQALQYTALTGARLTASFINGYLGRVYLQREQPTVAIDYLSRSLIQANSLAGLMFLVEQQRYLGQAFAAVAQYDSAFYYTELAERSYRKTVQQNYDQRIATMQINFETAEKEQQIEQQQGQLLRQRQQLYGVGGVALVLLTLGIGLFALWRRLRRKNNDNLRLVSEKETLLGEVHHRVKNNLQVISSLLQLQIRGLPTNDGSARAALLESQARVEAMGLIHQRLYQEGRDFDQVEMQDYLEELGSTLLDAYRLHGRVTVAYDIADITLDVDLAIPLGLIVNELISNSLKHAFPNKGEGTIFVRLQDLTDRVLLQISDDGVGLSPAVRRHQEYSFGTNLIELLTRKLGGSVRTMTADSYGTEIVFPYQSTAATTDY